VYAESVSSEILSALLLILILSGEAHAERLQVCTFSFHRPDEVQVFRALPTEDFELVDLSLHLSAPGQGRDAGWLANACRNDLRCDVVVFSAEFAGGFFGDYGRSLSLQEMEEASCQARSQGLFHAPREVFLLACNTLATKDQDRRTPGDYLQVLLDHGFDRASAERVVALRYGPLGFSFREAVRRIFMGVPRLYGFSSVAPAGDHTAPLLETYFRKVGDYRSYLEHVQRNTAPNERLLAAFRRTGLVQAPGLTSSEPAAADRDRICALYDQRLSVARRLRIVETLMERPDFLAFLPSIQVFFDRHPPAEMQGEETQLFQAIQRSEASRNQVLQLVHDLDVSALQLELAHFAVHVDWMGRDAFRALARDGARQLLERPLTTEAADILCEIAKHEPLDDAFSLDDLGHLFGHPEGLRVIDCLSPADPGVDAPLAAALDAPDEPTRLWAAYALSHRLPLPDTILVQLASHLDDPSLRERLEWIFRTQKPLPDEVRAAVRRRDARLADQLWPRARRGSFW